MNASTRRKRSMGMTILVICVVFVAGLVLFIATRPSDFRIVRSTAMAAPPGVVFTQVNDFHNWEAWNPWGKLDPGMKQSYDGEPAGVGAKYAWAGNGNVGEGRMTIIESDPVERVVVQLDFEKPMKGTSIAEFTFMPDADRTVVTWSMEGTNSFMAKAIGLVINMDKMIGGNFEQGLADMRTVAEATAAEGEAE